MKIISCFLFISIIFQSRSTLLFPVYRGRIVHDYSDSSLTMHPVGVLIAPSKDFSVKSCTAGAVTAVNKVDNGYLVTVSSNNLFYNYAALQNIKVKKGQKVSKGTTIGSLANIKSANNNLIFIVSKRGEFVDSKKYLVFSKN